MDTLDSSKVSEKAIAEIADKLDVEDGNGKNKIDNM